MLHHSHYHHSHYHHHHRRRRSRCPFAAALIAAAMLGSIPVSTSSLRLSSSTPTSATSTASSFTHNAQTLAQEESRRITVEEHMGAAEQRSLFDAPGKAKMEMDWAGAAAELEDRALKFVKGVEWGKRILHNNICMYISVLTTGSNCNPNSNRLVGDL